MTFAEKIEALETDVHEIKRMQGITNSLLLRRNNEESDGECMLVAVKVLLSKAALHYEDAIATLKGPEVDA